ncbi:MAG: hypothetical protein E7314_05315 [Clostridiales bacterium]|nr:hypothetical protein [Clostridiales bacterium]
MSRKPIKNIYLRIEHYKAGEFMFSELHPATMSKDFIYVGKYKIKKADTEVITHEDKGRFMPGLLNRCIKLYDISKSDDDRFILL